MNFKYEANDDFKNGYIYLWVNEKNGESVKNAFINFMEALEKDVCSKLAENVVYDENNKPFLIVDLSFHGVNDYSGEHYHVIVNKNGVQWGVGGPPQMTMSAVGGAGGKISLKEFSSGALDEFVLRHLGIKKLEEMKKNVRLRLENL